MRFCPVTFAVGIVVEDEAAIAELVVAAAGAGDADVCGASVGVETEGDAEDVEPDFEPVFAACMSLSERNSEDVKVGFN